MEDDIIISATKSNPNCLNELKMAFSSLENLVEQTNEFNGGERTDKGSYPENEYGYNLKYSNAIPEELKEAFDELIQIFQKSLERTVKDSNNMNELNNETSFLVSHYSLYKLYETMLKESFDEIIKYSQSEDPGDKYPVIYNYNMNSCCFESATISVSSNATIKNNVAAHTPEYVHVSEVKEKKRRTFISKETRDFLETAFKLKRSPNSRERKIIAEKCGLTPLQVRVWFTNKRMRSK